MNMNDKTEFTGKAKSFVPKPIDPIGSVLNHLTVAVIIVVVSILSGIGVVFLKIKPFFTSEAIIKIEPVIPKILYGKEEASITPYYDDFVRTQINIVKSYPVISRAIESYQAQGFKWQLPGESLGQSVERLVARLTIKQLRDTQLFSLSMTGRRKEGLAELINTVATEYLNAGKNEQLNKDSSRLVFLKERKVLLETKLDEEYSVLEKISARYAVGIMDEKNIYVYLQAIVDLTQQRIKAATRRIEMETRLNEFRGRLEKMKHSDLSADIDVWIEQDPVMRDERIQLSRKLQNMRLTLGVVEKDHQDRKEYEKGFRNLLEEQEELQKKALKAGEKVLRGKLLSDQKKKILDLETEYAVALSSEEKLGSKLADAERKATDVNTQMLKASTLRREIQRLQDSLHRIDERIDQIEVESRSPGRITLMAIARTPDAPASGKRSKMIVIIILFSFVVGLGYSISMDKLDDKIRTTKDIERVLGFPATGHVMDAGMDIEGPDDLHSAVTDNPFSHIAEQYKQISFALSMEHKDHSSSIYTCLSLGERHGTTSMSINILDSLKVRKEKKILVDLNVWNSFSKGLTRKNKHGLREVLEGKCNLKDVIITNSKYPFHILPFGGWQKENGSIFQEIGLDNMIEALRLDYDYIIIDSPPLPLTTDAKFLAQLADVVVLVVKAGEVGEKALFRSVSMLDKIGVKVISVVLNRVKFMKGKYYKSETKKYQSLITH